MRTTLVLNADFAPLQLVPLSLISWQDAISLIYQGKARAVDNYENEWVHSPSIAYQVPSVIVLLGYKKISHKPKYSKFNIKLRDEFTCQYCNKIKSPKSLTIDHVKPKSKGGKTTWTNIVSACKPCNQLKKDHIHIRPKTNPYVPSYYELAKKLLKQNGLRHKKWQPYIPVSI